MATKAEKAFASWKKKAVRHGKKIGACDSDIWDDDDPYDLAVVAKDAFDKGTTPAAFIEEIFADDIASRANDRLMEEEALEAEYEERWPPGAIEDT